MNPQSLNTILFLVPGERVRRRKPRTMLLSYKHMPHSLLPQKQPKHSLSRILRTYRMLSSSPPQLSNSLVLSGIFSHKPYTFSCSCHLFDPDWTLGEVAYSPCKFACYLTLNSPIISHASHLFHHNSKNKTQKKTTLFGSLVSARRRMEEKQGLGDHFTKF